MATLRREIRIASLNPPASTLVELSALVVPGMRVEIEAVVGLPG